MYRCGQCQNFVITYFMAHDVENVFLSGPSSLYDCRFSAGKCEPDTEANTICENMFEPRWKELDLLQKYLKEKGIPHLRDDAGSDAGGRFDRHQIRIFSDGYERQTDIIVCHYGSAGYEQGLLQHVGEATCGESEGMLSAENVIAKLEEAHIKTAGEEPEPAPEDNAPVSDKAVLRLAKFVLFELEDIANSNGLSLQIIEEKFLNAFSKELKELQPVSQSK